MVSHRGGFEISDQLDYHFIPPEERRVFMLSDGIRFEYDGSTVLIEGREPFSNYSLRGAAAVGWIREAG